MDSPAVLVVDDIPKVADSIVAVLRAAGLSALAVHDGRAAVQGPAIGGGEGILGYLRAFGHEPTDMRGGEPRQFGQACALLP